MGCVASQGADGNGGAAVSSTEGGNLPAEGGPGPPQVQTVKDDNGGPPLPGPLESPSSFRRFQHDELTRATNNFNEAYIISEGGRQAVNVVYRGQLRTGQFVAIKRYQRSEWSNAEHFVGEAYKVGSIRCEGLVNLLGFCCEDDARYLVADFMAMGTLSQHLFHWEKQPMSWEQRLTVAVKVAQALAQLSALEGCPLYYDLNTYRVLYGADVEPRLSCFGLLKPLNEDGEVTCNVAQMPPELVIKGAAGASQESVVWCFGMLLLALLSGKRIRPLQFLELVEHERLDPVVDSNLNSNRDLALDLIPLVVECLQDDPTKRPPFRRILRVLAVLEARTKGIRLPDGPGPGEQSVGESFEEEHLSAFGSAAANGNMRIMHVELVNQSYDETIAYEFSAGTPDTWQVSFAAWAPAMREMVEARRRGDQAFQECRWEDALDSYSLFTTLKDPPPLPLMHARRSFCYLQTEDWQSALREALAAQYATPTWPEAYYLQAVALRQLGMMEDSSNIFQQGRRLEASQASSGAQSPGSQRQVHQRAQYR